MKRVLLAFALLIALLGNAQQLETVTVGGQSRTMMVYAPSGITENSPLVISLHGANQDAAYQRDQTKWNNCADTAKFVVVYPNAINKFWDTSGQSDINFISWIIDKMYDRYKINRNRVYISGFSLGAMMTYHCMEHLGTKVAAFAPVSGVRFDNRRPTAPRRVPFIHTHGTGDDVFKWTGDPGHAAGGYPYIPTYVESWATYEGLTEKEVISPYPSSKPYSIATLTIWRSPDADDNIEIALLALKDKGHWHSEDIGSGVSTTQEIWRFMKRYSLQPEAPTLVSADPENLSFDLTESHNSFKLTFSDIAEVATINAALICGEQSIALSCVEAENAKVINLTAPEGFAPAAGEYQLHVSGIKNPEGGNAKTASVTYYYGASEYGDKIKADFSQLYDRALVLYDKTADATALSVTNARSRLKKYIDMYAGFASTSPTKYAKATENLKKNMDILEAYLESLGIADVEGDTVVIETQYFDVMGRQLQAPQQGLTLVVQYFSDGKSQIQKIYR